MTNPEHAPFLAPAGRLASFAITSFFYGCRKDEHGLWYVETGRTYPATVSSNCLVLDDMQVPTERCDGLRRSAWYPVLADERVLAVYSQHLYFHDKL